MARQQETVDNVYRALGVKTVINAAGTFTQYGGSPMAPEVIEAWKQASEHAVDLFELSERVGQAIAELVGVEAALVTSGAAGAIVLGTAAAISFRNGLGPHQLPVSPAEGYNAIRPADQDEGYDSQIRACGLHVRCVASIDELAETIDARTSLMFAYNLHMPNGPSHDDWLERAQRAKIPTLLDAAADIPPIDTLWKYTQMGYDMVAISGGKMLAGPQDAGLLLGRRALIDEARRHASPHEGVVGRSMKVCKEDMVAMWAAVRAYLNRDHGSVVQQWDRALATIEQALDGLTDVWSRRVVPPIANAFPHLLIDWNQSAHRLSYAQMTATLAEGDPPIVTDRVHGTGTEGLLISVVALRPAEEQTIARRLRQIFDR